MIDRYIDRPNLTFLNGKYSILDSMCFAEFLSHYYLPPKNSEDTNNDNQPTVLEDTILEKNHRSCDYPLTIPLMNSKYKLRCRKVKAVLRYYVPNRHKYPKKYAHHLLFMFHPFRNEDDLKSTVLGSYNEKLQEPGILEVVNRNKLIFEPHGDLVDTALLNLRTDLLHNSDAYSNQENDQVQTLLNNQVESDNEDPTNDAVVLADTFTVSNDAPSVMPDNELNEKIRSLNSKQRQYFEIIFNWAKPM